MLWSGCKARNDYGLGDHMEQSTLVLFSQGRITKEQAIEKLGLRDYAELLIALGDADLPLFKLPEEECVIAFTCAPMCMTIELQSASLAHSRL